MAKKTIHDVDVKGKRVLVRVDFNVPLDDNGNISDDTRIAAALPTIRYLLKEGARVILCSHLGRPKGKIDPKYSLIPVGARLKELLPDVNIWMADDVIGESARTAVEDMKDGEIVLLENLRFHAEEEKNDPAFAKALASLAELYVSDAFGTVHRAHASTAGVAAFLPAVAGDLIGKELAVMGGALEKPERPFVAILGGKKVSDKIGVITNLLEKCDALIIGGGMAYTFFKAKGWEIGDSLLDAESVELAKTLMQKAEDRGVKLLLPLDTVVADRFDADAAHKTGVFEMPAFAAGTEAVARACAECGGVTIIGGGDSAAAVKKLGYADRITHISTGGGASLEFLEGKTLPGVAVLQDK
ncbi:MAG: phosphoglycerate kinase [Clostridia bacterium]|nr:phosphoglycerate kinase [Clostridia bacterium]